MKLPLPAHEDLIVRRQADQLGIYVHFPYCIHKCSYCDFYSAGMDRMPGGGKTVPVSDLESFATQAQLEYQSRRDQFKKFGRVNSIFFGGGTASLLPAEYVDRLLELFRSDFDTEGAEITVEGNPENFSPAYIESLAKIGVNRIHVGVQSLHEHTLRDLDRYYDRDRYSALIETLAHSRIGNRGVDLMYGVPNQAEGQFMADLRLLLSTGLTHVSLYSLTAEPGTPYEAAVRKKKAPSPDEDLQAKLFQELPEFLSHEGFIHYEVSNFARPGFLCRHNLRYWLYEPTLAIGPGAHGFDGSLRYANPRNVIAWQNSPASSPLTMHDPSLEIPLCILRILVPIAREDLESLFAPLDRGEQGMMLLQKWANQGLADFTGHFQWKSGAVLFLDDRIMEMQEVLSPA
jgi:oxygen-independent coproporphyrinogen-3 oxidase